MQDALRLTQLVDVDTPGVKGVFDARRCLGAVADGDHDRRGGQPGLGPGSLRLAPVATQQIVGIQHQVGQGVLRSGAAVEVVLHFRVIVDVVQARFVGSGVGQGVVAHHYARSLDQA